MWIISNIFLGVYKKQLALLWLINFISSKIINIIMFGNVPDNINLQTLFDIASKYEKFGEQEKSFYN